MARGLRKVVQCIIQSKLTSLDGKRHDLKLSYLELSLLVKVEAIWSCMYLPEYNVPPQHVLETSDRVHYKTLFKGRLVVQLWLMNKVCKL